MKQEKKATKRRPIVVSQGPNDSDPIAPTKRPILNDLGWPMKWVDLETSESLSRKPFRSDDGAKPTSKAKHPEKLKKISDLLKLPEKEPKRKGLLIATPGRLYSEWPGKYGSERPLDKV